MAKKKRKSTGSRRRSRIGAMALNPSSPLVMYGSIAAGFLLGGKINEAIDKVVPVTTDQKLVAGGQAGLGALLTFKKGKKNLVTAIGGGVLLGSGVKRAMTAFGIGGYQNVLAVAGYQSVPSVNGVSRIGYVAPNGMALGQTHGARRGAINGGRLAAR